MQRLSRQRHEVGSEDQFRMWIYRFLHSLKHVLALVVKTHLNDSVTIEPIHLLAAIPRQQIGSTTPASRCHAPKGGEGARFLTPR